ncbi:MAG TPA: glycosyltransferase family A protein [Devosia sp.]|nr:glycosyltransferase family A protein [Devosia sp.]
MNPTISVIMPAFRAEPFIAEGVRSVLAQTYPDWQLFIVADDGADYEAFLAAQGVRDPRMKFLSSGTIGGGASRARNFALDLIDTPHVAILDADDRFQPQKLERVTAALADYPIVSSALAVMDDRYRPLRRVGAGPDRVLTPGTHKFTCLSMDSMIAWDRRRCDARYDLDLTNMTDLELLLQLWRTAGQSFHIGTPVHDYLKVSTSMSNGPGFSERMIQSKLTLLARLNAGHYPMADASGPTGLMRFLELSLLAEESYPEALTTRPGLLFEDHLEPLLARPSLPSPSRGG